MGAERSDNIRPLVARGQACFPGARKFTMASALALQRAQMNIPPIQAHSPRSTSAIVGASWLQLVKSFVGVVFTAKGC